MVYFILITYIAITFLGSLVGSTKTNTPEGYFLAGRDLTTMSLFFTILATNFSAFYFLGFAGEGYRIGYAHYIIMSLGTGFACLSFYLIGTKAWQLGKANGYITPSELIYDKTGSNALRYLYAAVMILFTFPYLALQIVGGGYLLESITQGDIPYFIGAAILTAFTIVYVWIGGMHSVAKTDLKQGLLVIILMTLGVIWVSHSLGGFAEANRQVFELKPELFSREGMGGQYTPQKWFSFLIFWLFCIPMFPQIFMRFFIARDLIHLKRSALLYGLIPVFISILPVSLGIMGHLSFPDLAGKAADQILPMMLIEHTSEWFAALIMTGALAAFMSTLDSQLLALSTIVTRDFYLPLSTNKPNLQQQVRIGRIWVLIFALIGLAIAYQPFDTIFDMGKMAFAGLSVLFPLTLAILRWGGVKVPYAIASILVGELLLILFFYKWLPSNLLMGFESFIFVLVVCFGIVIIGRK